jgi:DNA-binding XRE family transcriptional regulator
MATQNINKFNMKKHVYDWQDQMTTAAGITDDFRTIIKSTRETLTITQTAFAQSLGVTTKHLSLIENHKAYPSWPLFFEMIGKLGLSMHLNFNAENFKQL